MSENQNNNKQKGSSIFESVQYNVPKSNLTKFNAQYNSNTKSTPPTFQPEKVKPSNIILTNEKPKK